MTEPSGRPKLFLPLRNRTVFRDQYFDHDRSDQGGIFVLGDVDVALGDEVDLEIHFHEEQVRFHIRALVKWKRANLGRRSMLPGVGLEFLPSEEGTRAQLLAFVDGQQVAHVERESRRYGLHIDARLAAQTHALHNCVTDDLSEGGCFLLTDQVVPIGSRVSLKLRAPQALFGWVTVDGTVVWRRQEEGRSGLGIEFLFDGNRVREKVRRVVHILRERTVRELRVRAPRALTASTPPVPSAAAPGSIPPSMLPRK